MEYKEASNLRKKGIFGGITQGLVDKKGLGSSISDVFKAKVVGIKEKFDPMNIARMMGGKLGAGIYGKVMGRNQEDMEHFTGMKGKKQKGVGKLGKIELNFINKVGEGKKSKLTSNDGAATVVGKIYNMINKSYQDKKLNLEFEQNFKEEGIEEDERRHEEFLKAIKESKEAKPKVEKPKKPKEEKKKEPTTQAPIKGEPAKAPETGKPAAKAEQAKPAETRKPAAKAEQAKVQEAKPATKVEQAKPAETKPATKVESVKPKETPKTSTEKVTSKEVAKPSAEKISEPKQLGKLSSKFETGGAKNAAAIVGWDSTGGTSYGTYQIASKVGAMTSFLAFAQAKGETDIVSRLKSAGPADTGKKSGPFVDEWKKIAAEKGASFEKLQHDFIEESQYKPAARTLLKKTGYDVEKQSPAIKDVFFSTVVQHGQGSPIYNNGAYGIFKKAIDQNGGPDADPKNIIASVYAIRATQFGSSTEEVRKSVQNRFVQEKALALYMLNETGQQIDQSSKENKDLKQTSSPTPVVINNNGTTLVNTNQGKQQFSKPVNTNSPYVNAQAAHG